MKPSSSSTSSRKLSAGDLKRVNEVVWEIPPSFRADMRVPARAYASERMLNELFKDESLPQLVNVTTLPGIQRAALVMPDVHEGYGFPIGGVAAMEHPNGVISPGGIGYDINCGVRLLTTGLQFNDIKDRLDELAQALYRTVPSGVGRGGGIKLNDRELDEVLKTGLHWAVKHGYATPEDARRIESYGTLDTADPSAVSAHAKGRGRDQLGTMGAGNHFVEVGRVERILDEAGGSAFGLRLNLITVLIHCGSRGLGHQVATDYIRLMLGKLGHYKIELPDRELACAPFDSPEGRAYVGAMQAAANFAWVNRQLITHEVRQVWRGVFGGSAAVPQILYDVAHNIAKIEPHQVNGGIATLIVHRKGATRAFPPGHPELDEAFRAVGQPVIIPGSMGTASYVLVGTEAAMRQTFGSCCHGAGRRMSRHAAKRLIGGPQLKEQLTQAGVHVATRSLRDLPEEAPLAYKDVDEIVAVVAQAGLAKPVARIRPLAVIKG